MHQLCGAGSRLVGVALTIIIDYVLLIFYFDACVGLYLEVASGTIRVRGGRGLSAVVECLFLLGARLGSSTALRWICACNCAVSDWGSL